MSVNQCRKPTSWVGRLILWTMNVRHSPVTDWGLSHIVVDRHFTVLDVGCGGGRTVNKLAAAATEGTVYGIDYSATSVAVARSTNRKLITAGRVDVRQASVSQLPFLDETFDLVTAVETHYYWPDLAADMREIRRVLKPGGRLAIIAETYKGSRLDALHGRAMELLGAAYLTVSEHRDLFTNAGYSETEVFEEESKSWICALGRKPAPL